MCHTELLTALKKTLQPKLVSIWTMASVLSSLTVFSYNNNIYHTKSDVSRMLLLQVVFMSYSQTCIVIFKMFPLIQR